MSTAAPRLSGEHDLRAVASAPQPKAPAAIVWRGFIPTRLLVTLGFLGLVPLLLAVAAPPLRLWAVVIDAALLALALIDRSVARRARVDVARQVLGRLNVGVEGRVALRLRNRGGAARLLVRDDAPDDFGADPEPRSVALAAGKRDTLSYAVTPTRRGRFVFGDLTLRSVGPLGLAAVEGTVPARQELRVFPDLRGAARLILATATRDLANLGLRRLRRDGSGSEFARLREYVQGDPLRDVDWKATARRRKPVTRVHEVERSQTVLICVDAGRSMAAKVDALTKLDYAVNAALFLAFVAIRNGDRVGIVVFADGVKAFLPPDAGKRQYRRIVDALYRAEPALTFVDYQALFRELSARMRKRALVTIFTDLIDEQQAGSMVAPLHRLARRHVPLCVTLKDQGLETMLQTPPDEAQDAWRHAVALELLEEREALKSAIGREGVQLLDAAPSELTLAAVNRYLEVKRRGLL